MKMFPLIDGAEYKLFDAKMISLTDGARNKLFGTKMFTPSPLWRWGFYIGDSQCLFLKVTSIISVTHFFNLLPMTHLCLIMRTVTIVLTSWLSRIPKTALSFG